MQILDKNCSFVPKFVFCTQKYIFDIVKPKNLYWKNKKKFTFCIKNEVFAKEFHQNVQILDKNCSFVPKNIYLIL